MQDSNTTSVQQTKCCFLRSKMEAIPIKIFYKKSSLFCFTPSTLILLQPESVLEEHFFVHIFISYMYM